MPDTIDTSQIEPACDVVAELGEGPFWDPSPPSVLPTGSAPADGRAGPAAGLVVGTVLWVDIPGGRLHRTQPSSGETETADLGAPLSVVLPAADGSLLVARQHRLVAIEPGGPERLVAGISAPPSVRFNDAATDPRGRVWIGSMDMAEKAAIGALYRLDRRSEPGEQGEPGEPGAGGLVLTPVVNGVTVSNGLGWSPDGSALYYVDSPTRRIDVFDYDPDTGEASGRRLFAGLGDAKGVPDGLTVDADGCVWVALHGGGVLRRYQPDGRLDGIAPLPATHVTSCAFGGPGLTDLYVTTARAPLPGPERAAQPMAGRLLRFRPGPAGLPQPPAVLP